MANPRKFSDKIALHTQKQAEETAAFEAILREVSATTKVSSEKPVSQQLHRPVQQPVQQPIQQQQQHYLQLVQPNFGAYRGQSLPNVNKVANNSIDLQSALSSLEDMRQAVSGGHQPLPDKQQHRDRGHQSQKKFSVDRHRDCSPYGSVSYLSPPPDTSWRRASSDSALHATVQGGVANLSGSGVMMTNGQNDGSLLQVGHVTGMETGQMWDLRGMRPRSCEVPGINIYPSPDQGSATTSILISNNTGSLPDLANLNFPSSLMPPLDGEGASTQQCSSQDSGILENYVSPAMNITLQLYQQQMSKQQQQQQQGLPMASAGIQRHMVPAPLVLHGSNSFLMGGNTVLAQDNFYPSSLPSKSFSDSRSPPPYSSYMPPKSSPLSPPLITLTDVTQNGHEEKILFSEFERENGWHQPNGWSNHLQMPYRNGSHGCSDAPMDYVSTPLSPNDSLGQQRHRHSNGKSSSRNANRCGQSNAGGCKLEDDDGEMRTGDLATNCGERIKTEDVKVEDEGLSMAQYRTGSSDAPQSPVSPLSQPSSSYSPSQSPGTSASMASSPQMVDVTYQPDISTSQLQQSYTNITSQLGQQPQQQLTRLLQKPLMQPTVENLPQKFQQIKVADNGNAQGDASFCAAVQQQMQQHQLQQHLQQQQQQLLSQQQQQQQAAAAALMSSGNVVFMQTVLDHQSPILISSIAPNSFYQQQQPMTLQSIISQQQQPQQQQQQQPKQQLFHNPYVSSQNLVSNPEQQQVQYLPNAQQSPGSSTIPDIVLTAADLSLYANQAIMDIKNTGRDLVATSPQTDMLSREGVNLLSYLGDSFDSDMLTTDDFLKLGLDPLELEEIRMLSDANMVTDPATEDSFRLDRM